MKYNVVNKDNKIVSEIELDDSIFAQPIREDILSRVIAWQLARRQAGTHKTKEIAEVCGTGKKAYKQKGTGSARHGSRRAPQFRGGSVIFGPVVRSHEYDLQKKVRKLGLKVALSAKFSSGDLIVVDTVMMDQPKTKMAASSIPAPQGSTALLIDDVTVDNNFRLAVSNLNTIDVLPQIGANVYDIMRKDKLILTVSAVKALEARLK
jgi:large subunit ribosomal protein L4